MDLHRHAGLIDQLAAEYALGVLRGSPRRRFESIARHDPAIRLSIEMWRSRLQSMAELGAQAAPPPEVWLAIERRLNFVNARRDAAAAAARRVPVAAGWFGTLAFWRGWALASTAIAALALVIAIRHIEPAANAPQPAAHISYVATLVDKASRSMVLITWDDRTSEMTVHRLSGASDPTDKSMQLWGLPQGGHPVSLGVLPQGGTARLKVPSVSAFPVLAISVEPVGGSPDPNGPTGPVVYTGKVIPAA
jgi:anti-sigma-K factor RskA